MDNCDNTAFKGNDQRVMCLLLEPKSLFSCSYEIIPIFRDGNPAIKSFWAGGKSTIVFGFSFCILTWVYYEPFKLSFRDALVCFGDSECFTKAKELKSFLIELKKFAKAIFVKSLLDFFRSNDFAAIVNCSTTFEWKSQSLCWGLWGIYKFKEETLRSGFW